MSDYIFSSCQQLKLFLADKITSIYQESAPKVFEYHGDWGSLAVSQQHYNGFLPFENEQHICVVLGAPVLYFRDNNFLTKTDSSSATESLYQRWVVEKQMCWDKDLSGPFTVFLIDKTLKEINAVTDLMTFIPIYNHTKSSDVWLSSHVDALAKACGEQHELDEASLADFILNDVVTFPFTVYKNIRQLKPGTAYHWQANEQNPTESIYWQPLEEFNFASIDQAATELRSGIQRYVNTVSEPMPKLAQFISAGEDSRALSGMLPQEKSRDAYIFLDHMNREGIIAKKVAETYKANFTSGYRSKTHYLDILPESSILVGAGHQYTHAHSLGFDKKYKLAEYPAVFGGYLSDSLLKGAYVPKVRGAGRFPFVPDFEINRSPVGKQLSKHAAIVDVTVLDSIKVRQNEHFEFIKKIRPTTANEWFVLYPASMRVAIPNYYSTRRLFKSYEPFLSHESVKVASGVPTSWKLNRRLFNRAVKPFLKPSQWMLHADGRLPYFGFIPNIPLQSSIWFYRHIAKRLGLIKGNQGPWGDWANVFSSEQWNNQLQENSKKHKLSFFTEDIVKLAKSNQLNNSQKTSLMQVLNFMKVRESLSYVTEDAKTRK